MHILDIFETQSSTFSFEFFPPRSEDAANTLFQTLRSLERLKPAFVSVTYGAGGASRQLTHDLVLRIQQTTPLVAVPHLTCVGHRHAEIQEILERYAGAGVSNVLALGGDPPRDQPSYDRAGDAFRHEFPYIGAHDKFPGAQNRGVLWISRRRSWSIRRPWTARHSCTERDRQHLG